MSIFLAKKQALLLAFNAFFTSTREAGRVGAKFSFRAAILQSPSTKQYKGNYH